MGRRGDGKGQRREDPGKMPEPGSYSVKTAVTNASSGGSGMGCLGGLRNQGAGTQLSACTSGT